MENASKALIMAATVLLSLLLVAVFINVFRSGASVNESYDRQQISAQLELYNAQFEDHNVQYNTIMDLITVANLAYSVNEMVGYDELSSVKVELVLGNKTFTIPNEDPNLGKTRSQINELKEKGEYYERNKILLGTKVIDIYDLLDKPMNDPKLNISFSNGPFNSKDKLTKTFFGNITYDKTYMNPFTQTMVTETVTELYTVYKYVFDCVEITHHELTGRVASMKFERNTTIPSSDPLHWKTDYDK